MLLIHSCALIAANALPDIVLNTVLPLLFILLPLLFIVFAIVHTRKQQKKELQALEEKIEAEAEDLPFEETRATLLQKFADIDSSGKYHRQIYAAEFLTDDGERVTLEITEEAFQKIQPQETGLLITLNGKFYDFGDGSDV